MANQIFDVVNLIGLRRQTHSHTGEHTRTHTQAHTSGRYRGVAIVLNETPERTPLISNDR